MTAGVFIHTKPAVAASSGDVANATASASLPATPGVINYLTGFTVTGTGPSSAATVLVTVTGLAAGTLTFPLYAAASGSVQLIVNLPTPLPASASNTAITVSCPALGTGSTHNAVNVFGFQL